MFPVYFNIKCLVTNCKNHNDEGDGHTLLVDGTVIKMWICMPCWETLHLDAINNSQLVKNMQQTDKEKLLSIIEGKVNYEIISEGDYLGQINTFYGVRAHTIIKIKDPVDQRRL